MGRTDPTLESRPSDLSDFLTSQEGKEQCGEVGGSHGDCSLLMCTATMSLSQPWQMENAGRKMQLMEQGGR